MIRRVKLPISTAIIRSIYGLFLLSTGIMTLVGAIHGIPIGDGVPSPAMVFLRAALDTGYLWHWVGIFKIIVGIFLLIPKSAPMGVIMTCGYSVNILLWVVLVANEWLLLGMMDFLANAYLVYSYSDFYKPIFSLFGEKTESSSRFWPKKISLLCLFSLIFPALLLLYHFLIIAFGQILPELSLANLFAMKFSGIHGISFSLISFAALFGAIQIWNNKKIGFYIFTVASLLYYLPVLTYSTVGDLPFAGLAIISILVFFQSMNLKNLE